MTSRLAALLAASAAQYPDRVAVIDPARGVRASYAELLGLVHQVRDALSARGVGPGDRVGVSGKSIGTLAAIFGALDAGAAYVPVDATAPAQRGAGIYADCGVRAIVGETAFCDALVAAGPAAGPGSSSPARSPLSMLSPFGVELELMDGPGGTGRTGTSDSGRKEPGLSYVLYTSGSTGKPKGVMHTDASALAFLDWCSEAFSR